MVICSVKCHKESKCFMIMSTWNKFHFCNLMYILGERGYSMRKSSSQHAMMLELILMSLYDGKKDMTLFYLSKMDITIKVGHKILEWKGKLRGIDEDNWKIKWVQKKILWVNFDAKLRTYTLIKVCKNRAQCNFPYWFFTGALPIFWITHYIVVCLEW